MFENATPAERNLAIQRLTALWALNECGLGGILHALNSPFTGLLVGSLAMTCIAFICALARNKWQTVMTSLLIVLVIKALVSPHSTPTAYLAVTFQGITGALIYRYIPYLMFSSVFFLSLGLLESAFQRLITLTVLYGNTLWEAIDIWGEWVTKRWGLILPFSSSTLIIYSYLLIHLIAGVLIGWFVYRLLLSVQDQWGQNRFQLTLGEEEKKEFIIGGRRKKKKWKRYILFLVLVLIILLAYSGFNQQASDIQKGLISIIRAVAILTVWFVFLAPWIIKGLQKLLKKKHQQLSSEVAQTMDMFPHMLWIIDRSWKETHNLRWWRRWKSFMLHTLLYILQYQSVHDPDPDRPGPKL